MLIDRARHLASRAPIDHCLSVAAVVPKILMLERSALLHLHFQVLNPKLLSGNIRGCLRWTLGQIEFQGLLARHWQG